MIKVLIVEDDPMVAFINKQYLLKIGGVEVVGDVCTEKDVEDSLKKNDIDLILLDVVLPEKSGLEILKNLRMKKYLVDVIIISASNNHNELREAFALGAVDYLIKPFQFERFEKSIKKYITKNKILNKDMVLNQEDIDELYSLTDNNNVEELPKGLTKITLENIINVFKEHDDKVWTLREIAAEVNLSNVTIKKYMDYLEKVKRVNVEISYGNIGRPEYKYKLND